MLRPAFLALLLAPSLAVAQDEAAAEAPAEAPAAEKPAGPATYTIDNSKGLIFVQVLKDENTVMSGISHNHAIQAKGFSGTVTWDPASPAACKIELSLPVAQLDVDPQWLRDKVGYTQKLKDSDRESIRKNMLAKDQLNVDAHPTISFSGSNCSGAEGAYKVRGSLTIRGQSAPVTALMDIDADGKTLKASGGFEAKHTDFGFDPYSAMLGALKNRNELQFTVKVEAAAK